MGEFFKKNKKGQVTSFIIIAIILVAGIALFLIFRDSFSAVNVPKSIQPVYNSFLSCIEDEAITGAKILESQGGYIELPELEEGSSYMPFSSQLNFLGNQIPYWYYVSGSGISKEKVPSKTNMEDALEDFIDKRISNCNFENYYSEGFDITLGDASSEVSIRANSIIVEMNAELQIEKEEDNFLSENHKTEVNANLGKLYNSAKEVYDKEQKELFLENYAVDAIRLYAPVDGVAISCSPKTWNAYDIFSNLQEAVELNTLALTNTMPSNKENKYFFVNAVSGEELRFLNSKNWASSFEVLPSEGNMLIANPVGNQAGLGAIGFCYVPYHFVYNFKYPVLIQVSSGDETFQFPFAVVVQGNKPRTSLVASAESSENEICKNKNTETIVNVYDNSGNTVDASISYECFNEICPIGEAETGVLVANMPQCVNGIVTAEADGFEKGEEIYSTMAEGIVSISMKELHKLDIELKLNNFDYNDKAIIYFDNGKNSKAVSYPEQKIVELSEGNYNISAYIYKNSSFAIKEITSQQCVDSASGLGGIFGITEKKCYNVQVPSQTLSNALSGGGKIEQYISESELQSSDTIEINAEELPAVGSIEDISNNYILFDSKELEVNFA